MSTVSVINVKHPSSASNNIVLDSSGNATFAGTAAMASSFLRNRIINGDMRIDQRNAGASVNTSSATSGAFQLDRWKTFVAGSMVVAVQQSSIAPTGFTNSTAYTVSTADASIAAGDLYVIEQPIEGFNCYDLNFGASPASTVTLSFWVRSSITGTYCGALGNSAENRSYVFAFSVNSANTWEQKTIAIPGDTAGTWLTNNGIGIRVRVTLGAGSNFQGTANAWSGANLFATASQTQWVSTNGATFYLTGVQLEVGTAATPFERRQFGQELALCQRYFQKSYDLNLALGSIEQIGSVQTSADVTVFYKNFGPIRLMGPMRVRPSITAYNPVTGSTTNPVRNANVGTNLPLVVYDIGQNFFSAFIDNVSTVAGALLQFHYSAFAEL